MRKARSLARPLPVKRKCCCRSATSVPPRRTRRGSRSPHPLALENAREHHVARHTWTDSRCVVVKFGGLFHLPRRQLFAFNIVRFGDISSRHFSQRYFRFVITDFLGAVSDFLSPARYQISRRSKSPMFFRQHRRAALSRYQTCRKIFKFEVMYGSASHPAIINGKDSRKGRRGSRFQLKYRKQPHAK
jgi:hypothetical protein